MGVSGRCCTEVARIHQHKHTHMDILQHTETFGPGQVATLLRHSSMAGTSFLLLHHQFFIFFFYSICVDFFFIFFWLFARLTVCDRIPLAAQRSWLLLACHDLPKRRRSKPNESQIQKAIQNETRRTDRRDR